MQSIINKLRHLEDEQLLVLSEAIDIEILRREERLEEHSDSARACARQREQGYRSKLGTKVPPIRAVGMKDAGPKRKFAA